MTKEQFAQMKEGSIFINAARGTCVVIEDLAEALKSGHLAGAAVDVFRKSLKQTVKNSFLHYATFQT